MKASSDPRMLMRALVAGLVALSVSSCALFRSEEQVPTPPAAQPAKPPPKAVDKGDPSKRFATALELYRKNQVQEAEAAFLALSKDFPDFSGPWTNLGIIYAKSNRRDPAIGAMQHASVLNPQNAVAWNWLGILYRQANDLGRSQGAYEKALAVKSDDALAHYNLAILLDVYLHRPNDALPHYKEYERLAGKQDLKVMAWVAEIEARNAPPAPAPTGTTP